MNPLYPIITTCASWSSAAPSSSANQQTDSDGYKERKAEIKAAERWRRP
jgi:hypothetical protein